MEEKQSEVRLVFLGAAGVGKTALIRRFLNGSFRPEHCRTVDELHRTERRLGGVTVTVSIMDTSGSYPFPAMRRLSIQKSHAFALVYAVTDPESLEAVKSLRDEILEVKEDKRAPIVVIGNKADRCGERRVSGEDVSSTVELDWNGSFLEASAKDDVNVQEAFGELLQRADPPARRETSPEERRRRPADNKANGCNVS